MPAPLRIKLTPEEDQALFELRHNTALPRRTRERAEILRLNARGWRVTQIAEYLDWEMQAVRKAIYRWQASGIEGLGEHKSKMVKDYWALWEAAGLYFFFLPPYSAEMNRIEDEWHQLRNHELAGRSYEDEYELVKGIIEGVKERGTRKRYITERYIFNPA